MNHEIHELPEKGGNILYAGDALLSRVQCSRSTGKWGAASSRQSIRSAWKKEFQERAIPFSSQQELRLYYKNSSLEQLYRADFLCYDKIVVELKAVTKILPEHRAQVLNYLKASAFKLGLIVNFGHFPKAEIERIIL